jgi:hypothetical protein
MPTIVVLWKTAERACCVYIERKREEEREKGQGLIF